MCKKNNNFEPFFSDSTLTFLTFGNTFCLPILPTTPDVYTEIAFKSKDGVQLGTYFNEKTKKWVVFIYTKSYTSRSAKYFDETELSEMIEIMKTAKNKIQELTK